MDVTLNWAIGPVESKSGVHRCPVPLDSIRQDDERREATHVGVSEPGVKGNDVPSVDDGVKAHPQLVTAGKRSVLSQDRTESRLLFTAEGLARTEAQPAHTHPAALPPTSL